MAEPCYVVVDEVSRRLAQDALTQAREPFVWLVEGGSFAGLVDVLHLACVEYQRRDVSAVVAHVRRRHFQGAEGLTRDGPFSSIAVAAEQTRTEVPIDPANPQYRLTSMVYRTASDVVRLRDLLRDADDGIRSYPLICVSDIGRLLQKEDEQAPLLRLIREMHMDGVSAVAGQRLILGFSPRYGSIVDIQQLLLRLGSVRPTRHYVSVSSLARPALEGRAQIIGAVAALSPDARRRLGDLVPMMPYTFTAKEHELLAQGLVVADGCPDGNPDKVFLSEAIAVETVTFAHRESSRPLRDSGLGQTTVACYVDLDNCGGKHARAWVQAITGAVRRLCASTVAGEEFGERTKCWFVLVASSKTAVGRVPSEFFRELQEDSERHSMFRKEDLDRVEMRVVPDGKEAADVALIRLIHWDGPTTHRIVATKDKKLLATVRWSKGLCAGRMMLVTSREVRGYVEEELRVPEGEVVWVEIADDT